MQPVWQAAPQRPVPPAAPVSTPTFVASQPRPKVRAVAADSPPPVQAARLTLPSPEELGIRRASAAAPPSAVDWNEVHARLDRLGVQNFQRDRLPQGGYRVLFTLPAGQAPAQHVEATGPTEAVAVLNALQRAEGAAVRR